MFGKGIPLFTLFGFRVRLDWSWFILALLIAYSLAAGAYPQAYPGLTTATYWWMGLAAAVGIFLSIVLHELSHSLVARRYGIPIRGITLFIFGGVAEMEDQPPSPESELWMAIAGPIMSFLLACLCYGVVIVSQAMGLPIPVVGVFRYLAAINLILGLFNLIPAFPLDGGRVLRSILWRWKNNVRWATRVASGIGSGFGLALVLLGVLHFLGQHFVIGIWYVLIGMFLRNASQMSFQQLLTRKALEGQTVDRFVRTNPITVPPSISIRELVDRYFYNHYHKMFPVTEDGHVEGCVSIRDVQEVPREEWDHHTVREIAGTCSIENTIPSHTDAMKALSKMYSTGNSRLLVMDEDRLVGVVSLKDMLRFLSMKIDLEEEDGRDSGDWTRRNVIPGKQRSGIEE